MIPPMLVALLSLIAPVLVKLLANVNIAVVPKIPPMVLIDAVLVTASAFVIVFALPVIAFDVTLPNKPPTFEVPEILLVDTCVVESAPLKVPPVMEPNKPPTFALPVTLPELLSVPENVASEVPEIIAPMIPPIAVALVSAIVPVFVKFGVIVAPVITVPKIPPMELMAAVELTFIALV